MDRGNRQAKSTIGMISTAFPSASEAGVEILRAGGNAIDAAVAAAWALSVCEPSCSGLGGQTIMQIRFSDGKMLVIDGQSFAPAAVSKSRVSRSDQRRGYRACTIPTTPATLDYAQSRYGILSRTIVMAPAIRLADEGYVITALQRRQTNWCRQAILGSPGASHLFLKEGLLYRKGDVFRQQVLAKTLGRLADVGGEDFYRGRMAEAIVDDMEQNGGLISKRDLAEYRGPIECKPVVAQYRDTMISVPHCVGGMQILLGLKILEQFAPGEPVCQTDQWYQMMAEVVYAVFRKRKQFILPNMGPHHSLDWQQHPNREWISNIVRRIHTRVSSKNIETDTEESGETTHLCTADGQGNVVSLTQSIQSLFGAKVVNGRLGFFYNNYLSTCKRRPHPNELGSHCIPLSNVSPTIVLKDKGDNPFLAIGAAGSRRITSSILHVITGIIDHGLSLEQAIRLPRIHGLLGRKVFVERPAATPALLKRLEKRFPRISVKSKYSYSMAGLQAIQFQENCEMVGMADPRRDGIAMGL